LRFDEAPSDAEGLRGLRFEIPGTASAQALRSHAAVVFAALRKTLRED
jgi:hypothetical protein